MHVFKHPKFYEELRKKRKQFQKEQKPQASSHKLRKIVAGQSVMLTTKLTQEPGILTQASSDKLRHNVSVKQNLPVREYLLTKQKGKNDNNEI